MNVRMRGAFSTPPVVMNLIIINALFYIASVILPDGLGEMMVRKLGLYYWGSGHFRLYQVITYMFLHADLGHLFFNMFALWMFGRQLEYDLSPARFFTYYFATGIGAALIQMGVSWVEIGHLTAQAEVAGMTPHWERLIALRTDALTVGASGAVFGILLAFGMLHPNAIIMLLFPPIPLKAKYFVIGYGLLELWLGISGNQSGVAHFAHLGGMIFGFLLLLYWKRKGRIYY